VSFDLEQDFILDTDKTDYMIEKFELYKNSALLQKIFKKVYFKLK